MWPRTPYLAKEKSKVAIKKLGLNSIRLDYDYIKELQEGDGRLRNESNQVVQVWGKLGINER